MKKCFIIKERKRYSTISQQKLQDLNNSSAELVEEKNMMVRVFFFFCMIYAKENLMLIGAVASAMKTSIVSITRLITPFSNSTQEDIIHFSCQ